MVNISLLKHFKFKFGLNNFHLNSGDNNAFSAKLRHYSLSGPMYNCIGNGTWVFLTRSCLWEGYKAWWVLTQSSVLNLWLTTVRSTKQILSCGVIGHHALVSGSMFSQTIQTSMPSICQTIKVYLPRIRTYLGFTRQLWLLICKSQLQFQLLMAGMLLHRSHLGIPVRFSANSACSTSDDSSVDLSHIMFSIPLNTNVVGGIVTCIPLCLSADLSSEDFFSRVCARMDLEPLDAQIRYRYDGDRQKDPTFRLANEDDWRLAIGRTHEKMKRARTWEVVVKLVNLVWLF